MSPATFDSTCKHGRRIRYDACIDCVAEERDALLAERDQLREALQDLVTQAQMTPHGYAFGTALAVAQQALSHQTGA